MKAKLKYKYVFLILVIILITDCKEDQAITPQPSQIDYKQEMREFVQAISLYAKNLNPDFLIIPQNGQQIVTTNGKVDGNPATAYLSAIDGAGREDLFYGYENDNQPTPENDKNYLIGFCDLCEQNGVEVLTIDYCSSQNKMADSYAQNLAKNYISFAAPERELNILPDYPSKPFKNNNNNITSLILAKNFLYLINTENFSTRQQFINAVSATDYDLVIMDGFFNSEDFTAAQITELKTKQNGGQRLVVSYMSIGEAEDYRYYWQNGWTTSPPDWLDKENPNWAGNFKVKYWHEDWQNIICNTETSYLKKILDAGFDGVYLDIIDAFEYFEEQ